MYGWPYAGPQTPVQPVFVPINLDPKTQEKAQGMDPFRVHKVIDRAVRKALGEETDKKKKKEEKDKENAGVSIWKLGLALFIFFPIIGPLYALSMNASLNMVKHILFP